MILSYAREHRKSWKSSSLRQSHLLYRSSVHHFDYMFGCSDLPVWKRLADSRLSLDERLALISSIFSDRDETGAVVQLSRDDAQAFVDVTYQVNSLRDLVSEHWNRVIDFG